MLTVILYGMKHTELLDWFVSLCGKIKIKEKYSYWVASIITAIVFIIFRGLEGLPVNASYISSILRSLFFTVIFESLFVDIPVVLVKGFGKFIDTKTRKNEK